MHEGPRGKDPRLQEVCQRSRASSASLSRCSVVLPALPNRGVSCGFRITAHSHYFFLGQLLLFAVFINTFQTWRFPYWIALPFPRLLAGLEKVLYTLSLAPREGTVASGVTPAPASPPASTSSPVSTPAPTSADQCSNGVEGVEGSNSRGTVCCPVSCGEKCGGKGCGRRPGGGASCCVGGILNAPQPLCSEVPTAPCIITGEWFEEQPQGCRPSVCAY